MLYNQLNWYQINQCHIVNTKRQIKKSWFSSSCRELRSSVKNYEKLINKCPYNADYRHKIYSLRSKLRRLCKHEEKMYKKKICTELNNTSEGNPKHFWKLLNKLNHQSRGKDHSDDNISKEEFIKFYKDPNSSHNEQSVFQSDIINEFNALKENVSSS